MKNMAMDQYFLLEKLAQEERGDCRRSKIKTLAKNIRDWWNHCCDSTPAERELEGLPQRRAVAGQRAADGLDHQRQLGDRVERHLARAAVAREADLVAVDHQGFRLGFLGLAREPARCREAQRATGLQGPRQPLDLARLDEARLTGLVLGQQAHQLGKVQRPGRGSRHQGHRERHALRQGRRQARLRARSHGS